MTLKGLIDERNMRRSKNLIKRESDERQKGTKNLKSLPVTVWIWQCQLDYLSLWVNPRGFQSAKVNAKVRLLAWNLDFSKPFFVERWFSYPWYLSDHEVHSFPTTLDSFLVLPEREFYFPQENWKLRSCLDLLHP